MRSDGHQLLQRIFHFYNLAQTLVIIVSYLQTQAITVCASRKGEWLPVPYEKFDSYAVAHYMAGVKNLQVPSLQ